MIKKLFSVLNMIVPKTNIILFNSFPFYSDNSKSVYEYILKNRQDILKNNKIYWVLDDIDNTTKVSFNINMNIIKKKSLKGIWIFLRAKYVFGTHGYFKDVKSPKKQFNVNLWHGCGYKDNSNQEKGYRGNYNIVTSSQYIPIHADLFKIQSDNIIITGLPRNDILFQKKHKMNMLGIEKKTYKRILLWLPTYRKASIGHKTIDGDTTQFGYRELLINAKVINETLYKENFLLLLKLHPLEERVEVLDYNIATNIRLITNYSLCDKDITIYELFNDTDALLSDYSSVVVDYLLTGKPIAYVTGDYAEYRRNRGFVFADMKKVMPGPLIQSEKDLLDYINNFDKINESYNINRDQTIELLHKYRDGNSSKRVIDYFFGKEL